jgi:DNA-binding response OmpR family regulator
MYKILICEDELPMLQGLKDNLELEGYEVDTASEGKAGLEKIRANQYHLVLLDVMMPGMSGFEVCKTARRENIVTPIIMLTARGEEIDKVLGLEIGADDYITKPFGLRELLARIKAVLRRYSSENNLVSENTIVTIGRLKVNFTNYQASIADIEIKMSHKEFELLHYLFNHKNQVVSRNDLMEKVWGMDFEITTRTVDNFIVKLRQKTEINPNDPKIILTVHGVGYKLLFPS